MSSETWTIASAIAAIVPAAAMPVSLVLVLLQRRRMRLPQETETALVLYGHCAIALVRPVPSASDIWRARTT
jgi:hypothetical protein